MNLLSTRNWLNKKYILFLRQVGKYLIKEIRFVNNRDIEIKTTPNNLRALLYFLKNHTLCQYKQLIEIACSDNPGKQRRFSIAYILLSTHYSANITVVIQTNEVLPVPSVTSIFSSAGWLEREVWDLFGIFFENHPDLRRILTDYGFSGHPLRKDFPLSGFLEVYYNDSTKRLSYEPVELAQEYRSFVLQSPWVQNYQKLTAKKK
jgi:NADH:ubiquinone oxidoreductase subunit C